MRRRSTIWLALALAGCGLDVAGALTLRGDGGDDAGTPPSGDAGSDTIANGDSSSQNDGAPLEGGCATLVTDDFTLPDTRWVRLKDAVFDGGAADLVVPQQQHHGAIFIAVPPINGVPPSYFEAQFTMTVTTVAGGGVPGPGDGIALAWSSEVTTPPIGGTGGDMGFCPNSNSQYIGPVGAALTFHTSSPNGVSPRESDGGFCPFVNTVQYTFGSKHVIGVAVGGRDIDAGMENATFKFTLTKPVPLRWIGFTSATGGAVARYGVDDVTIKVCP